MEEGHVICAYALSILQVVCKRVRTGDISMKELQDIKDKRNQMDKLCVAFFSGKGGDDLQSIEVLGNCINQRLREYEYFQEYCLQLKHLILHLSSVPLQGT